MAGIGNVQECLKDRPLGDCDHQGKPTVLGRKHPEDSVSEGLGVRYPGHFQKLRGVRRKETLSQPLQEFGKSW